MSNISRRKFLKTGAKGAALASIPIFFKTNPVAAILSSTGGELTLTDYYNFFKVDEGIINKIMSVAMERGGDYCDLFFQHRLSNTINLEDNLVSRANTNVDLGVGIRVIKGDQTGYSYTEDLSMKAMSMAAKTAANIANDTKTVAPIELKLHDTPSYYLIDSPWEEVNTDKKVPLLQKVNDRMLALDKRVTKVQVLFMDSNTHMMVANSDGRIVFDYQPMTRMFAFCSAEQDGRREENYYRLGGRYGIEHYNDDNLNRIAKTAVDRTITLFDAVKPEGGEMEVVLAAGEAGIILHEAIGHGMEADFNRKGESLFADKIGKKIAEDFVTIVDDGTLPNMRGTINVDD
ncbi:MAG: TldD/PmbA family protein, partial [candidate division Zixibacteria bacterium]|nr:TldD/PmbA family protein [candidate division Zixibacteria bacterium]